MPVRQLASPFLASWALLIALPAAADGPGIQELRLRHAGVERSALVHVPASYDAARPTPMVVALHGGGGGASHMAKDANYGLITKSEEAGFIVVFPNGLSPVRSGLLATWNAGRCCGRARDRNADDVGFLRAVVAEVGKRQNIDSRRVYAIGMSNGAMMAYRLACEAPDVFRGIMAVAGTDNTDRCSPSMPVPVLHVHARNDDRVLFEGGAGRTRRADLVTDFVAVPASIGKWVKLDHAGALPQRVLDVPGAYCDLHPAGPNGAPVQLCVTETGGHSWPGGNKARAAEAPSRAINANDLMWEFFSRQ